MAFPSLINLGLDFLDVSSSTMFVVLLPQNSLFVHSIIQVSTFWILFELAFYGCIHIMDCAQIHLFCTTG